MRSTLQLAYLERGIVPLGQAEIPPLQPGIIPPELKGKLPASGWPAPRPVVPHAWNMETEPPLYTVQSGDTLSGLAHTYMGSPTRVMELWNFQDPVFRMNRPDMRLGIGDKLKMPPDAVATYVAAVTPPGESPPNVPGGKASPLPQNIPKPAPRSDLPGRYQSKERQLLKGVAIAGGVAVGIGALYYIFTA